MSNPADSPIPVAIVGGGPVGLALAIELARQQVPAILFEQNAQTSVLPKANFVNVRSMEILRRAQLRDRVRAQSLAQSEDNNIVFGTRLFGRFLARMRIPSLAYAEQIRREWRRTPDAALARIRDLPSEFQDRVKVSAEFGQRIPQDVLEPLLRTEAERLQPGRILFGRQLLDFDQDPAGVRLRIRDVHGARDETLRARYLVGCDGANSPIRKRLGLKMLGEQLPTTQVAIYFESAELSAHLRQYGGVAQFFIVNAENHGVLVWSGADRYVLHAVTDDASASRRAPHEWIVTLAGREFAYTLLASNPWKMNLLTAERYRSGRVFLAGDAAHLVPPTGGFGMNTGLQDAMDLAWKLGACHRGWAGERLLESYDFERQQAFRHFHRECTYNLKQLDVARIPRILEAGGALGTLARKIVGGLIAQRQRKRSNFATSVFGYHYQGSPVLPAADSSEPAYRTQRGRFLQQTAIGYRAPHRWLQAPDDPLENAERCLFDECLVDGFTLIVKAGASLSGSFVEAAAKRSIPLKLLQLPREMLGDEYRCDFTLVRPDQHVAWQGDRLPVDARRLWAVLTGRDSATDGAASGNTRGSVAGATELAPALSLNP